MKLKIPSGMDWMKKISKSHLLIAALFGILLLVVVLPSDETRGTKEREVVQSETENAAAMTEQSDYKKSLERQLESILGAMDGVGRVEVMITVKDEGEAVVEKDMTRTEDVTAEEDSGGTKRENSAISSQEETIYIQTDSEGSTPFVAKELMPKVEGVLVVAQGGQNATVVKNISDAVLALFPVEVHKIKVVKMNE